MILCASIETERGSRIVKKASDNEITVSLFKRNRNVGTLTITANEIVFEAVQEGYFEGQEGAEIGISKPVHYPLA